MEKKGYTTGTCAALSAKAAAEMIFSGKIPKNESIAVPCGIKVTADIENAEINGKSAVCGVRKYSGDDPDVTDGILIYARVTLNDNIISIDGGKGVGRVTKPGLWQEVGKAAINKVPLEMIEKEVREVLEKNGFSGGADIVIEVPEGEETAKKTFNPRLGIEGGISILGTSGIVEPMSQSALIDTIKTKMKFRRAKYGKNIIISPGNYGKEMIKAYGLDIDKAVKCSNFVGEALDEAVNLGFQNILLIGHIGKFVKLAGGIMNTHSRNADSRMEIICANTVSAGGDIRLAKNILGCVTADEAVEMLKEKGLCKMVMEKIIQKADFYVKQRCFNKAETAVVMFSNKYGILGMTENAEDMIRLLRKENQ